MKNERHQIELPEPSSSVASTSTSPDVPPQTAASVCAELNKPHMRAVCEAAWPGFSKASMCPSARLVRIEGSPLQLGKYETAHAAAIAIVTACRMYRLDLCYDDLRYHAGEGAICWKKPGHETTFDFTPGGELTALSAAVLALQPKERMTDAELDDLIERVARRGSYDRADVERALRGFKRARNGGK